MPLSSLRRWSPTAILSAGLLLAVAMTAIMLTLASQQPWLGLTLAAEQDQPGLRVMASQGPARDIGAGTRVLSIGSQQASPQPLEAGDLAPEPDTRYPDFADYRAFLDRQHAIAAHVAAGAVVLLDDDGRQHSVEPADTRPWRSLPLPFWLQLMVAVSGFLLGVSVWAFRRNDRAALYLLVTGIGLMLSAGSAGIYSTRELALPADLFRILQAVNGCGSMLFCAAFVATLWHYPTRLGASDPGPALIGLYLLLSLGSALQWLPDFDIALRIPILAGFGATIVLAILQWRRTRQRPLERAALRWFLLAWFSGSTIFLGLVFVPVLFGVDTGEMQAYAFASFLLIYVGLAFGVTRYRLFQLDRWWLSAWSLLLLMTVLLTTGVVVFFLLDADPLIGLCLAVAATGWLYLPLRRLLAQWLSPLPLEAALPQVLQHVLSSGATAPRDLWHESLRRLFRPLHLHELPGDVTQAGIADNGLRLRLPSLHGTQHLELVGCEGGARLFNERDEMAGATMLTLISRLAEFSRAVQIGAEQERQRVSRDLHDDLGARLLDLLHRSDGGTQERVRAVMDELRLVTTSLGSRGEDLEDLLGSCRADAVDRLEGGPTSLHWQQPETLPAVVLDPHQALLIVRCLREGIANALQHGQPQMLKVEIDYVAGQLRLSLYNDGHAGSPPHNGGHTLMTLAGRALGLGGRLHAGPTADGRAWQLELRLALPGNPL